jgi:L-fuculose-phosphate aldolase
MYSLVPVGYVRSPFKEPEEAPRQGRDAGTEVVIEVEPAFVEALAGIEESARLQITCWLHLAARDRLRVHPRGDPETPLKGVFATRSPLRPNPIAVYTADLIEVRGNTLRVRGIDAVDGTPVVDIKPHARRLDD